MRAFLSALDADAVIPYVRAGFGRCVAALADVDHADLSAVFAKADVLVLYSQGLAVNYDSPVAVNYSFIVIHSYVQTHEVKEGRRVGNVVVCTVVLNGNGIIYTARGITAVGAGSTVEAVRAGYAAIIAHAFHPIVLAHLTALGAFAVCPAVVSTSGSAIFAQTVAPFMLAAHTASGAHTVHPLVRAGHRADRALTVYHMVIAYLATLGAYAVSPFVLTAYGLGIAANFTRIAVKDVLAHRLALLTYADKPLVRAGLTAFLTLALKPLMLAFIGLVALYSAANFTRIATKDVLTRYFTYLTDTVEPLMLAFIGHVAAIAAGGVARLVIRVLSHLIARLIRAAHN